VHLGGLALRLQPLPAHVAVAAGDVERDHDTIPRCDAGDVCAHLLDDAHRLVPEDVAWLDIWAEDLVQVQVGSADARGRHTDDRVGRMLDLRVRHIVDSDVVGAVPGQGLHGDGDASEVGPESRYPIDSAGNPELVPRDHDRKGDADVESDWIGPCVGPPGVRRRGVSSHRELRAFVDG
jgi:hypothetical protein